MSYIEAIILGIVQGLTEFLPVSSSGHLVLVKHLLQVESFDISFEVLVHLASLVAILIFFRREIWSLVRNFSNSDQPDSRRMVWFLLLGTFPAAVIGLLFENAIEETFGNPRFASYMLLVTAVILLSTRFVPKGDGRITTGRSILIGVAQALAILPGISRSGTTISVGLLARIDPSEAAKFSFLLAIPVIGGATLLKAKELLNLAPSMIGPYLAGAATSFIFSLLAVYVVMAVIRKGRFDYFAYYCFAAGLGGLYLF